MSKPVKKIRVSQTDSHPPSRKWLQYQFRRDLWVKMVHLHGTSIDKLDENGQLSDFDKGLIREFGGYKNDPTRGNLRFKDGTVSEDMDDEPVEVNLFTP